MSEKLKSLLSLLLSLLLLLLLSYCRVINLDLWQQRNTAAEQRERERDNNNKQRVNEVCFVVVVDQQQRCGGVAPFN